MNNYTFQGGKTKRSVFYNHNFSDNEDTFVKVTSSQSLI